MNIYIYTVYYVSILYLAPTTTSSTKKAQKVHNFSADDLITKNSTTNLTTSSTKKTQKVHNFPDDLITKISTTNSTTNHKKKHKKNTLFRLKKHNFPAQKFTTAAPPKSPGRPEPAVD